MLVVFAKILAWGIGCTSSTSHPPEPPPSPPDPTPATAPAPPAKAPAPIARKALPPIDDQMTAHFLDALALELAVIAGDLDEVVAVARRLEASEWDPSPPPEVAPRIAAVKEASNTATHAKTVAEAALASASLTAACGECHAETGGGPKQPVPMSPPAGPEATLHVFGASWMSYGLLASSDEAFALGASVLATAPLPGPPSTASAQKTVQARAAGASDAKIIDERARLWSDILATCATCHSTSSPPPSPSPSPSPSH